MAYYYAAAEQRLTELDPAVYAEWVQAENPKADYYTLIPDPPGPGYRWDGTQWVAPPPPPVPFEVSRFQAKAALYNANLLTQVETMMADPATDMLARLAWQDAQSFRRDSPTIAAMASQLGLSEQDVDALFFAAADITA